MRKIILTTLSAAMLTGCFGEDSSNDNNVDGNIFIAQMRAADFSSSEIAIGTVGSNEIVENYATQDQSDYGIDVYEQNLYHIGKFGIDTLTRYNSATEFLKEDYTYSLAESESSTTNAYQLVQVADNKAYVIRYGKTSIQIVDPSADEQNFVIGEIELSAYVAEGATYPRMSQALVHDGKLFVGMQRLADDFSVASDSYVAVIDIATNTEIDTNETEAGLKGIQLNADNLQSMAVQGDFLYVAGRGDFSSNSGALDRINLNTYSVENLIDGDTATFASLNDVSDDDDPNNDIYFHVLSVANVGDTGFVQINRQKGFTTLNSSVYSFDVNNATAFTRISATELEEAKISFMTSGPDDTLWVAIDDPTAPDVYILNEDGDVQGDPLEFTQIVIDLEFMEILETDD